MVNDLNKPPSQENLALGERLLASQRQLQEMQEEHRQLLQEMEVLRQRAAALSRLNEQQFTHVSNHYRRAGNVSNTTNENVPTPEAGEATTSLAETLNEVTEQTSNLNACNTPNPNPASQTANPTANDEDDENPQTAEYLQQKLAEIAKLKARFKHVQNIMNTTDKIEQHIASKSAPNSNTAALATSLDSALGKLHISTNVDIQSPFVASTTPAQSNIASASEGNIDMTIDPTKLENTATITDDERTLNNYAPSQTANEELLSTMMNMFTDFTADLRSQADDLRAERDRLRALKEDLLRRKRQS
ncbi:myb-like protein P [Eurosta solidaginis]|uniref:myb-like protein P n=1 Tax=Eurosta solidaginis TaxID=178769 RepID=UPI0035306DD3